MKKFGIDISAWQGDYDLARAKQEGVEFVIIRGGTGERMGLDGHFETNYKKAKNLGLPLGVYWYTDAKNATEMKAECDLFYNNCVKGRQYDLPIYIDVEGDMLRLDRRVLTDLIKQFCAYFEERGCFVGIYASASVFSYNVYADELSRYAWWVAQWSSSCSYDCGMWQFGGSTNVIRSPYVAGKVVDQNYMLEDYPTAIKNAGLNGYGSNARFSVGESVWIAYKVTGVSGDDVTITDGKNTFVVGADYLRAIK